MSAPDIESDQPESVSPGSGLSHPRRGLTWLSIAGFVYLLIVAVSLIGDGFKLVSGGAEGAARIFAFATNPVLGVVVGTIATALVQSSSTVTSVIVGLVAGGLPVSIAVPMIMGANMGTTITNTIVSLANVQHDDEFGRSFGAATVHDFFNLYSVALFLPIEMIFHPLERTAEAMAGALVGGGGASISHLDFVGAATEPAALAITFIFSSLPKTAAGFLTIGVGIFFVFTSVLLLGKVLRGVMKGRAGKMFSSAIGRGSTLAILTGAVVTILVQSSSTTTSLIVPLAGAGVLTLRQVYPFTLGANIGTCVTALLAATAISGEYEVFALEIALVHLVYNVVGVTVFVSVPWLRDAPVRSAEWLARSARHRRRNAFAYVFAVFFLFPAIIMGGQNLLDRVRGVDVRVEKEVEQLDPLPVPSD
jgi:sodium-dependent phosphate cotransporter